MSVERMCGWVEAGEGKKKQVGKGMINMRARNFTSHKLEKYVRGMVNKDLWVFGRNIFDGFISYISINKEFDKKLNTGGTDK